MEHRLRQHPSTFDLRRAWSHPPVFRSCLEIPDPESPARFDLWMPLVSFVGNSDPKRGLVVFSKGLHEGGVRNNEERSVFLTLLRCYGRTVFTLGKEVGQMLGRQTVEYAFMPACGDALSSVLTELFSDFPCRKSN